MKKLLFGTLCLMAIAAIEAGAATPVSGIDLMYLDRSVRPQDNFYQYVNGGWLATTQIPADRSRYGVFDKLGDDALDQLRGIVEGLTQAAGPADPERRKIADLYSTFMDESALEPQGLQPLTAEFARIDAIRNKKQIPDLIAHFNRIGISAPITPDVEQDAKDSTRYVFALYQDGLGMPNRDYYLLNDERLKQARAEYEKYIQRMLALAGDSNAPANARDILALETELAKVQWTEVENRDPVKTYNKVAIAELPHLASGYDWKAYLVASGVDGKADSLVITQPSYISGFNAILARTPLATWKTYFRWRVLDDSAPYLSSAFVAANFAFHGTVMRGIPQNRPRWKRAISLVGISLGEALGKLYVAKYFPPQSKARADQLVKNLLAAYKVDINTLDWMSPATRQKAQAKLAKFSPQIGYPDKWRNYSALKVVKGDLVGDVLRANEFEYRRNLNKLGKPVDRNEWSMTPQTVNAYYNEKMNKIVFPAAILQPPFFNAKADDAVNYGGIGAVIGHEISHGFDDNGSQYDGDGNLVGTPGWFTQADFDAFKAKTHVLVTQYAAQEPVPGYHVNGELTLGENIADNSGLAIAYKAYELSLGGKPAPVIDGFTGEQRFYMSWAQVWRGKGRDSDSVVRIKTDPHSPANVRGTVTLMNQAGFYQAFGIKPGDKMYLDPQKRVSLW